MSSRIAKQNALEQTLPYWRARAKEAEAERDDFIKMHYMEQGLRQKVEAELAAAQEKLGSISDFEEGILERNLRERDALRAKVEFERKVAQRCSEDAMALNAKLAAAEELLARVEKNYGELNLNWHKSCQQRDAALAEIERLNRTVVEEVARVARLREALQNAAEALDDANFLRASADARAAL